MGNVWQHTHLNVNIFEKSSHTLANTTFTSAPTTGGSNRLDVNKTGAQIEHVFRTLHSNYTKISLMHSDRDFRLRGILRIKKHTKETVTTAAVEDNFTIRNGRKRLSSVSSCQMSSVWDSKQKLSKLQDAAIHYIKWKSLVAAVVSGKVCLWKIGAVSVLKK